MDGMSREEFCRRVSWQMKRASNRERDRVKQELMDHLEDHAAELVAGGVPQEEADARAVAAMGDPEEVGKALNRQYSIVWRIASLLCLGLTVYLALLLVFWDGRIFLADFGERWKIQQGDHAQFAEWAKLDGGELEYDFRQDVDLWMDVGNNDELQVYSVSLDPENDLAGVALWVRDKDLNGYVGSRLQEYIYVENQTGARVTPCHAPGDAVAQALWFKDIPVDPADDHVTVCFERWGEVKSLDVPLPREVSR